jgi:hypothetical protein
MRTERRMNWASVLGLSAAVVIATFVYAVALLVAEDTDEDVDADADAFEGDQFTEFD